jgi:hypothetical protein
VLAATGSILADIVPSGTTGNGRGLAFDGKNLWYTLVNDPNIYKVSTTGAALGSITVAGNAANGGPLGWDGSALWTANSPVCTVLPCSPTTKILRVDPASGAILFSCDFVAANPADPGVVTPGTGISTSVDGGDWSTTAKAMWLSSEGSTNAGNWVVELNSTTCKVITEFIAPPKGTDGTSGLAFMADPNGDKLWHAHPNRPADIIQTNTAGITTMLPFAVPYSTEDLAFDPVTFAPKCAVWGNQATGGPNHLTAYEVPCPVAFATSSGAAFVIGDLEAPLPTFGVGNHVTWWSSQWAMLNPMSGGPPPNSMKGFAGFEDNPLSIPPKCGDTWTTDTGNSTAPPPTVPAVMGVLVSSHVTQSGSVVSGDIKEIVLVKNDPGYAPNPGSPGTGTIIGFVC